ncbi:hypothetical protein G5C63_19555 [Stenotrophomonas pavanii]|uniref:hypothetical protein n=1 Tax=Stenotrophomonas pavanii TaxID=487698 RepID=UPI0013DF1950|nr:hypothetical protein [Stenotrophomonas pavanii]NGM56504.1 hypothetical protein [Stenotrophomonas pavanii]
MNLEQIDTSTAAGKACVMQLAAEGRYIAERTIPLGKWSATSFPLWDWRSHEYAVIAEPVESGEDYTGPSTVYVFVDKSGNALGFGESIHMARRSEKAVKYIRADLAGEKG